MPAIWISQGCVNVCVRSIWFTFENCTQFSEMLCILLETSRFFRSILFFLRGVPACHNPIPPRRPRGITMSLSRLRVSIHDNFDPIINGYENNGKIPAAPGGRVDAFLKSYLGGSITNAVGMYQGVAILKMQNALQDSKAKCQHGIVIMVEALQKAGIRGWENYWGSMPFNRCLCLFIRVSHRICMYEWFRG